MQTPHGMHPPLTPPPPPVRKQMISNHIRYAGTDPTPLPPSRHYDKEPKTEVVVNIATVIQFFK
jgi:hypothetical protein